VFELEVSLRETSNPTAHGGWVQNPAYGSSFFLLFSALTFMPKFVYMESMRHKRPLTYKTGFIRKNILQKILIAALLILLISFFPLVFTRFRANPSLDRRELRENFEAGAFDISYSQSGEMLLSDPLDSFLLTIHGFSAYQLAIAQINTHDTLSFVDDSIWALRKALLFRDNSNDGRIFYVLGKAYYHKGPEYADLALYYLEKARETYHSAPDIPEYLGLSYAAIGDYRSSVASFSMALSENGNLNGGPSDILLLSIARSYLALEELDLARAYLVRCLDVSRDSNSIVTARLLLGSILTQMGDLTGAETEYLRLLEEHGENAEARYKLGEIYNRSGDTTRARAEWRRAVRIDPAHGPARSRLNM